MLTLTGPNGFALVRFVYCDDILIGSVVPIVHYDGKTLPSWQAMDIQGNSHGDRYISDYAAARQLALALGLEVRQ